MRKYFAHRLFLYACIVSLGIGALFARVIWTMRADEWSYAKRTSANLVHTLDGGLTWALDSYLESLQGVVQEVSQSELWQLAPSLQSRVVFDHSLRMRGAGDVVVTDARGQVVLDSYGMPARDINVSDRDYFKALQSGTHKGLYIGKPSRSRASGRMILPMALPYSGTDGAFAGVVVGAMSIGFFNDMFASLDMGPSSGVNLLSLDGVILARFPYGGDDVGRSIAGTPNMLRFQTERKGAFLGTAALDQVERLYTFSQVGQYPLIINVARSTETVFAKWNRSAWVLGSFALLLMASCMALAWLFVRELALRQKVSAQLRGAEHDLRTTLDNMPSMISYWDSTLNNRFANHVFFDWLGMAPDELRGKPLADLVGAVQFAKDLPFLERALRGQTQLFERELVDVHGVTRHTMVSYQPDVDADGRVLGLYMQVTDITERKRVEDELFNEKERARLTLQAIGDAVVCTDAEGHITYLNPVAEALTGWQAFDAAGRLVSDVVQLQDSNNPTERQPSAVPSVVERGQAVGPVRGLLMHRSASKGFMVEKTVSPITDRHGQVTGAVAVLRDVTEATAMAQRMEYLAQYDALTELPNRVLLQHRAQISLAQARRDGKMLAVLYLDLDGFKQVNDSLGHEAGDQLLVQFAQRLTAAVRASDTVSRKGGDEFVVLLPGLDSVEMVHTVARKIMATSLASLMVGEGHTVQLGLSGGIALYPQHGTELDALARHADGAMYAAKRAGRMRFMLYTGADSEPEPIDLGDVGDVDSLIAPINTVVATSPKGAAE